MFPTSKKCFSFYPVSSRIQVSKPTEDDPSEFSDVTTDNAGEASEHEASKHSETLRNASKCFESLNSLSLTLRNNS